jgi:hypothetical protein
MLPMQSVPALYFFSVRITDGIAIELSHPTTAQAPGKTTILA